MLADSASARLRMKLSHVDVWNIVDQFDLSSSSRKTLSLFLRYRQRTLARVHFHYAHLLTSVPAILHVSEMTYFVSSGTYNLAPYPYLPFCIVINQLFLFLFLLAVLDPRVGHTRSTQPCIPPGSLNRVPASAGVRAGMSPLPGGR